MNVGESFESALQSVKANKLRSFLTMLGIIIGISSVITIVSIGDGAKNFITSQFESMGTNVINVNLSSSQNQEIESKDYFTLGDIDLIKSKIPEANYVSAIVGGYGTTKVENKFRNAEIDAVNEDSNKIFNLTMIKGRFVNEHDVEAGKSVAVIDAGTAQKFFRDTDVVGEKIKLSIEDKSLDVTIIGVFKDPNEDIAIFGGSETGTVIIPITAADRILRETNISRLSISLLDMNNAKEIGSKVVRLMENKHRNGQKYTAQEGFKGLESINKVLTILTTIFGCIAGISLLVGGIGVMNIMLVSVTERTREIGIRKAIGAKTRDIKLQFLMESVILCLIGGTIGTISGISIGKIAGSFIHVAMPISLKVIFIAFAFSSAVGIFFGLYPASKAAKLDPIEALRYE
ncbi:ABC transporter permease [Clostridium magnum]|uniref:Macrolide export ATP-binding/permease protein MacB n=1 Tax=Clostridium magnum DSM 2767 TaxID=1121326 RepID=A0A162S0Q3_9CLOT|nr:ABC transporter permease [Clostridium magnum]KZL90630.1 macrolide export ATP-binding/permease protein MacB [Clostridium magnum DSM 2767]SHI06171.1 putative ABC transport system permease protein [Clostridium magnum DSM 2767]